MSQLEGWSADPSGRHQERFFEAGHPTQLVRDVGRESYDALEPAQETGAMREYDSSTTVPPAASVTYLEGWHPDPSGRHEFRYFAKGEPTAWFSDAGQITEEPSIPPQVLVSQSLSSQQANQGAPPLSVLRGSEPSGRPVASDQWPVTSSQVERPPGWYRNASNPDDVRYWDGSQWTDSRHGGSETASHSPTETRDTLSRPSSLDQSPSVEGWQPDPSGRHRLRWFASGGATSLVSDDDGTVAFDESTSDHGQVPVYNGHTETAESRALAASLPAVISSSPVSSPAPAADWYPDPDDPTRKRYWNGSRWAERDGRPVLDGEMAVKSSLNPSETEKQDDLVGKLERLAALRDSGALSQDEFVIAKQQLLSAFRVAPGCRTGGPIVYPGDYIRWEMLTGKRRRVGA